MDGYFTLDSIEAKPTSKGDVFKVKAGGYEFATFNAQLARKAHGLVGQPARITYTEKQNGQYTNRYLEAIDAAPGGGGLPADPFTSQTAANPSSFAVAKPDVGKISGRNNIAARSASTILQFTDGDAKTIGVVLNALAHWAETGEWLGLSAQERPSTPAPTPTFPQDDIPF